MEFDVDAGDLLKVNYSEKLVTLVKDGRALLELGFKVDEKLSKIIDNAKKFYKEGVCLKQIANFYNSMGSQIVDCQKPMMLTKAQQFDQMIKNPYVESDKSMRDRDGKKFITWQDPIQIEQYTKLVQEAAKELISENRKLRKVHNDVTQEVNQLMNINLLKQKQAWNAKAKDIKLMVE